MRQTHGITFLLILIVSLPLSAQEKTTNTPQPQLDRAALEKQFEETMSGASLIGHFTIARGEKDSSPQDEGYRVSKISKLEDGRWLFTAQMKFGDRDVSLPMPFEVQWAGDTPIITLTNQEIPGLGTFTARVLIYRDRYAGTWQHGQVGGHMWGRVEKAKSAER